MIRAGVDTAIVMAKVYDDEAEMVYNVFFCFFVFAGCIACYRLSTISDRLIQWMANRVVLRDTIGVLQCCFII